MVPNCGFALLQILVPLAQALVFDHMMGGFKKLIWLQKQQRIWGYNSCLYIVFHISERSIIQRGFDTQQDRFKLFPLQMTVTNRLVKGSLNQSDQSLKLAAPHHGARLRLNCHVIPFLDK